MKVTVCQFEPRADTLDTTLAALGEHARSSGSDLVLLPEMPFTPWLAAQRTPDATAWESAVAAHDQRIESLGDLGVANVLATRPIVNEGGSRRNQAFVWDRHSSRAAGVHEKYHLPDEPRYWEHSWYDRGERSFDVARAGEAIVGFQICTEMWFFEWARHYGASRVDLLCVPRATPRSSHDKWLVGGRTAAVCSGAYCMSSNHWSPPGEGGDASGGGWVIDPDGHVLATTNEDEPFATVEVDLDLSRTSKATYPRYVAD